MEADDSGAAEQAPALAVPLALLLRLRLGRPQRASYRLCQLLRGALHHLAHRLLAGAVGAVFGPGR